MPDLDQIKQGKQGAGAGGRQGRIPPAAGQLTQELHACRGGVALTGMGAPGRARSTTDRGGFAADLLQMQQDEIIELNPGLCAATIGKTAVVEPIADASTPTRADGALSMKVT